jgi:nicotinate-nucleotide adenylyltransferase
VRIGVLGGSFDPIHNAHLIIARLAIEQLRLDEVRFVVAAGQPFKQGRHDASAPDRLRMVELALDGVAGFAADGRELRRPPPSFTVDTLREVHAESPTAELVLIMGRDVLRDLGSWHDAGGVRALAAIAVCDRPDRASAGGDSPGRAADMEIQVPAMDLSSTAIRARAAAGLPLDGWVPRAVADYIVASRLYRSRSA